MALKDLMVQESLLKNKIQSYNFHITVLGTMYA